MFKNSYIFTFLICYKLTLAQHCCSNKKFYYEIIYSTLKCVCQLGSVLTRLIGRLPPHPTTMALFLFSLSPVSLFLPENPSETRSGERCEFPLVEVWSDAPARANRHGFLGCILRLRR